MGIIQKQIEIEGQKCVLLPDNLGESTNNDDSILVTKSTGKTPACWVPETLAEKARKEYPKARIFGFWQTILASDLVDLSNALTIYSDEIGGVFLESDGQQVVRAGRLTGGRLPFEVAPSIDQAVPLEFDLGQLTLPATSLKLPSEVIRDQAIARRRVRSYCAAIGVVITLGCAGAAYEQHQVAQSKKNELAKLKATESSLKSRLDSLRRDHVTADYNDIPQRQALANLLDLTTMSDSIDLKTINLAQTSAFTASVKGLHGVPGWADSIAINNDGSYTIRYKPEGK